jgi:hypothetical protein
MCEMRHVEATPDTALRYVLRRRRLRGHPDQQREKVTSGTASASASASRGPVQRANPSEGGLSNSFRIRLSVVFV